MRLKAAIFAITTYILVCRCRETTPFHQINAIAQPLHHGPNRQPLEHQYIRGVIIALQSLSRLLLSQRPIGTHYQPLRCPPRCNRPELNNADYHNLLNVINPFASNIIYSCCCCYYCCSAESYIMCQCTTTVCNLLPPAVVQRHPQLLACTKTVPLGPLHCNHNMFRQVSRVGRPTLSPSLFLCIDIHSR